jgi:FlaA1/EpsC-like NDP-sugar epimerase
VTAAARCLDGAHVVVTGGTGSLGQVLVRRLLAGELGRPDRVTVLSRDEAKQSEMRLQLGNRAVATDDELYHARGQLRFRVGDVRDLATVTATLRGADVVVCAAALKQVPACEYAPLEAVRTNVLGTENIVRAIGEHGLAVRAVVGISTDKACKPVNVMGMTKALQERVLQHANLEVPATRFVIVRYGNVLASRGSVVPLFLDQVRRGGPLTLTDPRMTRFLMTLDLAVETVFGALVWAAPAEVVVPRTPSARVVDIARALIGDRAIPMETIGIRPGEKLHEVLVSEEEGPRTIERDGYLVIRPLLPELRGPAAAGSPFTGVEYGSADDPMDAAAVRRLLERQALLPAPASSP